MKLSHHKTIWLSDIHLGNKDCKAELLLNFFEHNTCDTLYLVGDIFDMWQMTKQFRWPEAHNQVAHRVMKMSAQGTRIIYLPGNHDQPIQSYSGMTFGDIEVEREIIHTTHGGKRYLVLHGDQFDADVTIGKCEAWLGEKGYDLLLFINRWYNRFRAWRKNHYWSLSGYIKQRIKGANEAIARYRRASCKRAAALGLDGVICGHIHHPEMRFVDGIHYINDGDWIENCSALCEDNDGNLRLIHWGEELRAHSPVVLFPQKGKSNQAA